MHPACPRPGHTGLSWTGHPCLLDLSLWGSCSLLPLKKFKTKPFTFPSNVVLPTVPISVLPLQLPLTQIRNKGASLTLLTPQGPSGPAKLNSFNFWSPLPTSTVPAPSQALSISIWPDITPHQPRLVPQPHHGPCIPSRDPEM